MNKNLVLIVLGLLVTFTACTTTISEQKDGVNLNSILSSPWVEVNSFKQGDIVPNDEVCMVNNMYMGKKQMAVNHNGKVYYGCCEMCKQRIPKDETVRTAIDPVSKTQVDKAYAVIAITGSSGDVSYFENRTNYEMFLRKN